MLGMWPQPASMTSRDPVMERAIGPACAGPQMKSSSPATIRVGLVMRPSSGRRSTDWYRPPSHALPAARSAYITRVISASRAATSGRSGSAR